MHIKFRILCCNDKILLSLITLSTFVHIMTLDQFLKNLAVLYHVNFDKNQYEFLKKNLYINRYKNYIC